MIFSYLVGEGEWLREVEERAGESRRALCKNNLFSPISYYSYYSYYSLRYHTSHLSADTIHTDYKVRDKRKTNLPLGLMVCLQVPTDPFSAGQDPEIHDLSINNMFKLFMERNNCVYNLQDNWYCTFFLSLSDLSLSLLTERPDWTM